MSLTTIVFFTLVAIFAWRGYQKGFIGSIARLMGWILAYPAAIVFTKPFARWLDTHTALDGLIVYFIAGAIIFLATSFVVTLLLNSLSRLIPDNDFTSVSSRLGGLTMGVLLGGLLGLLAVYGLSLIQKPQIAEPESTVATDSQDAPPTSTTGQSPQVPAVHQLTQAKQSFIEASAKKLIGTATAKAVDITLEDKTTSQVAKAFVEDPQTMLTHVQAISNSGQMRNLMGDEKIQSMLTTGDIHGLMRNPEFQAVMNNEHMRALLAQSNIDSEQSSKATAEKMVAAWNRVNRLKHDPRVIAIVTDPEIQQQLNSPNKLPLMMNPKLNQLMELIFSSDTPDATGAGSYQITDISTDVLKSASSGSEQTTSSSAKTTIYRWTDENGQVHYADQPVNGARP
ncbi:CvpA family protein [Cellvibrio japonicus]|uniref:Putative CvpA family protein n=1 Tax=Cellvibrio japonicus (strain Ueda107) TaxID=498211 RepID=B3PL33_CELJU|nr:CvpA family protein [Cellvibrio japonicus]ACE83999.1 putative CvpA family protein [Cellvibrio japonicus Ueda107]QEI12923.1 DUF4124 domain-containing protein [Cellvibrio japonicus]QEI16497.1 DUF4124 domain-containing protein [Cellvibrio japonicus]QEI20075.1 DUF4124 domain-containing protein [Cellvibrio japonicus]